jgi:hypothetical protein
MGLSLIGAVSAGAKEESTGEGLYLIKSDEQGIVLELRTPSYEIEQISIEGTPYHILSVPGYAYNDQPGHPQLPLHGALLAIPPGAEPQVRILELEGDFVDGIFDLVPVPRLIVKYDPVSGFAEQQGSEWRKEKSIYSADALYPARLAVVESSGFIRDQRFLSLQVYPFQYNPATQRLKHYPWLRVEISFSYPEGRLSLMASGESGGPFEAALRNTILNYESARGWRESSRPARLLGAGGLGSCEDCFKISIREAGIYELNYSELTGAGLPVDPPTDPHNFHLYNQGEEVAIYVEGEDNSEFEGGEYILFYGEGVNTKYTDTNVYWLTVEDLPGLRMVTKPQGESGSTPDWFEATARVEEGHWYMSDLPFDEAEHWYWEFLQPTPAEPVVTRTYSIHLNNLHSGEAYSATLRSGFMGATADGSVNPDHHVLFYVNGFEVEDAESWWDGKTGHLVEAAFPNSFLEEGANVITVVNPDDTGAATDVVFADWFEITYRDTYVAEGDSLAFTQEETGVWEYEISNFTEPEVEAFDVTDPLSVSQIITDITEIDSTWTVTLTQEIVSPTRYLVQGESERKNALQIEEDVPSDLRGSNGADYVIISHSDFLGNVGALADHRAAQGYVTKVVDVQDIYDEFNFGLFDAQAIREFLAHAYEYWDPRPSYVLLVGDGNYDFKNYKGYGEPNFVPPYLACVGPQMCEIAADNRYVCVSGTDNMPDMFIGRLPVKTPDEADAVIDKILAYEASPPADWRRRTLFAADSPDNSGGIPYPDVCSSPPGNHFWCLSDYIADNYLPSPLYIAEKVYYGLSPYVTQDAATTAIIDGINAGRLIVNYTGHGYIYYWSYSKLLEQSPYRQDLELLTNSDRFPLVVAMSCLLGHFAHPSSPGFDVSCLSESLLRAEGKGAAATWAATGYGEATGHKLLDSGFFTAVFTDGVLELGAATAQAAWGMPSYQYLVDQYVLFGDPAMRLAVEWWEYDSFLPLATKQY